MPAVQSILRRPCLGINSSANTVHFQGSQTFNGNANVTATGDNQSVIFDNGIQITEDPSFTFTVNTTAIVDNGATFIGNPPVFHTPTGAGTYANDSGPLDLAGLTLNFVGDSLTIISVGDIINTGGNATIDLSNGSGNGGRLYLLAGFDFSPGTGGVTTNPANTSTTYAITGVEAGSINLPNINIDTSGSALGGTVSAYANGSVTLGTVNTSGGTGHGGNVNIIGQGVTVGSIAATGATPATAGQVSIISANVQISGSISVNDGLVSGGKFTPNVAGGSISLGGVIAGTNTVSPNSLSRRHLVQRHSYGSLRRWWHRLKSQPNCNHGRDNFCQRWSIWRCVY